MSPLPLLVALTLVPLALAGCGGAGTTSGTTRTGTGSGATQAPPLRCSSRDLVATRDAAGDVSAVPLTGAPHRARMPSADLVSVSLGRGRDGVVCVSYRLAGPIRLGSTFALATRQRAPAAQGSQQRYEAQLTPDGRVFVSRPHGEPRYPVRARVAHQGDTLELAMQTLLRSGEQFDWRADVSYLPRFPLGASYVDSLPDGSAWLSLHRPS